MSSKKLSFLWPHEEGSLEEALFEFGMAHTEEYAHEWYLAILERLPTKRAADAPTACGYPCWHSQPFVCTPSCHAHPVHR